MLAGTSGYVPTILKARRWPETEHSGAWALAAATSLPSLGAVASLAPHIVQAPAAGAVLNSAVALWLIWPRRRVAR